ncbi:hypothetical protein CPB86DRAFT_779817, partial [Serendipita vermifera]
NNEEKRKGKEKRKRKKKSGGKEWTGLRWKFYELCGDATILQSLAAVTVVTTAFRVACSGSTQHIQGQLIL